MYNSITAHLQHINPYSFFVNHLTEGGQCRPKHVAGVLHIYKYIIFLLLWRFSYIVNSFTGKNLYNLKLLCVIDFIMCGI
jgi:hypothetical protein